jgi:hypothetical protein
MSGTSGTSSGWTEGPGDGSSGAGSSTSDDTGGTPPVRLDVQAGDDGSSGGSGDGACPCENVMDGIYLLSDSGEVWFYKPDDDAFSSLGRPNCPGGSRTVNSMSVDRRGNVWMNYFYLDLSTLEASDGRLFVAPLADLQACEDVGYMPPGAFQQFGMGFSVQSEGSNCDELYVFDAANAFTSTLGRIDTTTLAVVSVGGTADPTGELTGTGDGRLYGFSMPPLGTPRLIRFDKSNGAELESTPLPGISAGAGFAFAQWGGDFYFFTDGGSAGTSVVNRLDYDKNEDGELLQVNPQTPARIVGAGVSTCASYVPPVG